MLTLPDMVYGIFTAGQRSWGGPRADAERADVKVSPKQAIQYAEMQGDELNVVPETFKPDIEAATHRHPHHAPLMPSGHLEGRFAPAEELTGGWFRQTNDSGALNPDMTPRQVEEALRYAGKGRVRDSMDSAWSSSSTGTSIGTPRRVESIVDLPDALKYLDRQAHQRPAGGAYFERDSAAPGFGVAPLPNNSGYAASVRSFDSGSSVSLHFDVPSRRPTRDLGETSTTAAPVARQPLRHPEQDEGERGRQPARVVPERPRPIYVPANRSELSTQGRSPLGRRSFTRVAADYASSVDGNASSSDRMGRRHSIAGEGYRGRRSISVDRYGRRRLSKSRRPGRRSGSEG